MRRGSSLVVALPFAAALLGVASPGLQSQPKSGEPKRPKLVAGSDTNDAQAYYDHGLRPNVSWKETYDAFYWALRLDPANASYLLALRQALWYKQPYEWRNEYYNGADFVVKSKVARDLDTLTYEVWIREPFAHLYGPCRYPEWIAELKNPLDVGYVYYDSGCYRQAAEHFGQALAKRPRQIRLHLLRARSFYFTQQYDSAVYDLQKLIDSLRTRDQKKLQFAYESKEMFEYMVGDAYVRLQNYPAAREAYGRALAENLAFYQAHAKLATAAMLQGDLPTALAEYEQAVQLKENDGVVRHNYGVALLEAGRLADAEAQFRKAIELEPHWALARFNLAVALDKQDKKLDALSSYNTFLERVPRRSFKLTKQARGRVAALSQ